MNTYQNINSTKTQAHAECAPTVALHDLDVDTLYQAIDPTSWEDDPCEYPVTVMLDDVEYGSKAEVIASIQEVNSRISERKQTLGLAALADAVTQGRTCVPAVVEGSRRSGNWKSQQVFPLDFDGGESIEQHLQACEYLELWPAFIYPSFSHTEEAPRFRSVFVTDKPVEDVQLREEILGELHRLFPKADTKCKDPARLFFGTKSAIAYERWDARFPVSKFEAREHFADSQPSTKNPSAAPSEDEAVHLIHGASYGRLYDADLLDLIQEYANEFRPPPTADGGTAGLYRGPEDMFVFLVNSASWIEIGKELFAPGLFLWNSEVGCRTVGVSTFYWQAVFQNHIVWNATDLTEFSRKHTANVGDAFEQIRFILDDFAKKRAERKDGFMDALEAAMQAKLPDDADKIIAMLKKQGIPQHWSKEATSMAMKKGAVTLWSIVDALTQLAGKIPNAGERTQLDQQAGALLSVAV